MKKLLPILQRIETVHTLYIGTFLFFLSFIVYGVTLGNGLFYDDEQFIYKNIFVQNFDVGQFFAKNVDAGAGVTSNYYRPLLLIVFGLIHSISGSSGVLYHLASLLFHAGSGIMLYILLTAVLKNKLIALFTAVLFIIHPIQTEAVAYASGMGDPMGMLFMLLATYYSFSTRLRGNLLAWFFFICALLSKELTIITPVIIWLFHMAKATQITRQTITTSLKKSLPFIGINIVYIGLRLSILNFANTLNFYTTHTVYSDHLLVRIQTFLSLLPKYLSLIFYPRVLYIDHVAPVVSAPTVLVITVFLSILGIISLSIFFYKRTFIPLFSILLFFTAFIPTSGLIPINGIFFEHFFYYPSIGFFLLVSYLIYQVLLVCSARVQILMLVVLFMILSILSIRTIVRNNEWHDPITFYEQTIQHTQSVRIYNNLAMSYADAGNAEKAVSMYKAALKLGDFYPQTHYNLANSYVENGDIQLAEQEYRRAVTIDPYFYHSYFKLFALYKAANQETNMHEIIEEVARIAKKDPSFTPILQELEQAQ